MVAPALATTVVDGALIADDALKYRGAGYVYGGTASRVGDWDCSSFVSYVLGHDLGLGLPGGRWGEPGFPPGSHGPVVTDYATWTGAATIPAASAQPGDLAVFVGTGTAGHIGIVTGQNQMCSALDSQQGTVVTPVVGYGPPGAPLIYRRITGTGGGTYPAATTAASSSGGSTLLAALMAGAVVAAMAGIIVGAAALAGLGADLGAAWAVRRIAREV